MLVPGIHSDSKIKLQEEVLYKKQESLSERLASLFVGVFVCGQFGFISVGFRRAAWAFFIGTGGEELRLL